MMAKLALRGDFIDGMRVEIPWKSHTGTVTIEDGGQTVRVDWDDGDMSCHSVDGAHENLLLVGLPEGSDLAVVEGEIMLDRGACLGRFEVEP